MNRVVLLMGWLAASVAHSEDAETFQPPKPYEVQRYEAGWNRNPFTLKTAPVAVENAPFAKDLTIGSYYGDTADPTIVIVNTKTNDRYVLKRSKPSSNGMTLKDVKYGSGRKDFVAEVTLGSETSEIRYNDTYVKQMAAAEAPRAAVGQPGQAGRPPVVPGPGGVKLPVPQQPGAPTKVGMPGMPPAAAQASQPGMVGTTAGQGMVAQNRGGFVAGAVGANSPNVANVNLPSVSVDATGAGVVSQTPNTAAVPNNAGVTPPIRRRLLVPAAN